MISECAIQNAHLCEAGKAEVSDDSQTQLEKELQVEVQ